MKLFLTLAFALLSSLTLTASAADTTKPTETLTVQPYSAFIRATDDAKGKTLGSLFKGAKVTKISRGRNGYIRVEYTNFRGQKRNGYMHADVFNPSKNWKKPTTGTGTAQ